MIALSWGGFHRKLSFALIGLAIRWQLGVRPSGCPDAWGTAESAPSGPAASSGRLRRRLGWDHPQTETAKNAKRARKSPFEFKALDFRVPEGL